MNTARFLSLRDGIAAMKSSLAPQLVVLAAVLSAVALAAPVGTAYEAEATELVSRPALPSCFLPPRR